MNSVFGKPRKNKYGNTKCQADGLKFDSKKEMARYFELKVMQQAKQIRKLKHHDRFYIFAEGYGHLKVPGKNQKIYYEPDFTYEERSGELWVKVIEDVKSPATAKDPVFRLKKALIKWLYGIDIRLT